MYLCPTWTCLVADLCCMLSIAAPGLCATTWRCLHYSADRRFHSCDPMVGGQPKLKCQSWNSNSACQSFFFCFWQSLNFHSRWPCLNGRRTLSGRIFWQVAKLRCKASLCPMWGPSSPAKRMFLPHLDPLRGPFDSIWPHGGLFTCPYCNHFLPPLGIFEPIWHPQSPDILQEQIFVSHRMLGSESLQTDQQCTWKQAFADA